MKIIVTGGAGFIGSHLVDRLAHDAANEIVVIDNFARGRRELLAAHEGDPRVTLVAGDIRDAVLLNDAFTGADTVYHLAAQSNVMGAVSNIDYSFTTNVVGTYNVLAAARAASVRRVVFASSREVYGEASELPVAETHPLNAKNAYGASKAAGELYCRVFRETYGLDTAILRLANVYGPRDHGRVIPLWFDAVAEQRDLTVFGGQQLIDFVWVDQVVEAFMRAATRPVAEPINIGSGRGTPILELAERVIALSGTSAKLDVQPARSIEVARFEAEITRMREQLDLTPPEDPLFGLPVIWESWPSRGR
ncbi:MAG: NAD-dependent epimerase/dehydratase family protein [Roseiflexaceae bacterium]|nr:NAD-dependent epimerase/dehydratase family protein [Roseiflexaceae bacterium]